MSMYSIASLTTIRTPISSMHRCRHTKYNQNYLNPHHENSAGSIDYSPVEMTRASQCEHAP